MSAIDITTLPPFSPGGPRFVAKVAHLATELHATTQPQIVGRYLLLKVGEPCTEFRRLESERILRAQPFIADAEIVAAPDGKGGTAIRVITVDEVSLVLDGSASTKAPVIRGLRIGEQNLAGEAISTIAGWQRRLGYRDVFKGRFQDYQFLGQPYQFLAEGTRADLGGSWNASVSHPFLTLLQRVSWRATAGNLTNYQGFLRDTAATVALRVARSYGDVGGVRAIGPPRHVFLVGGTLSRERERIARNPVLVLDNGIRPDTSSVLRGRYEDHQSTRLNLLLGFRNIRFVRVTGFNAVEGTEDLRTGVQLATLLGRSIKFSGRDENDYLTSADLYAATGSPTSFLGLETLTEGRRDLGEHDWDGILASGRAAAYLQPWPRHTAIADLEFSGGWRERVPFQVRLASRDGGLPGYQNVELGGGQRLVARLEDRYRLGHVRQLAALAGAAFLDAGKLWAGDTPYGVTTGVKLSAGISLLGATPPRSRRTWRVDLAVPINAAQARRLQVVFSNQDFTRWFWREPGDLGISRERSIPTSVYNWP